MATRKSAPAPKAGQRVKLATGEIGTVVDVAKLGGKPAGKAGGFTVDKNAKPNTLCVRVRVGDRGKGVLRTAESVQVVKSRAAKKQPLSPEAVAEQPGRDGAPVGNEPAVLPPGPHRDRVQAAA